MESSTHFLSTPDLQHRSLDCKAVLFCAGCFSSSTVRCSVESRRFGFHSRRNWERGNVGAIGDDGSARKGNRVSHASSLRFGSMPLIVKVLPGVAGLSSRTKRMVSGGRTESTTRSISAKAKDSSQHDTADPASEEKPASVVDGEGESGALTEPTEMRADGSGSSMEVVGSSAEAGRQGFVLGLGQLGAWDSGSVGAPVVRRYLSDNEERWLMWYNGSAAEQQDSAVDSKKPKNESVGLAISSNGIHWERGNGFVDNNEQGSEGVGKVLDCSSNWWAFDSEIIRPSDVLVMSSLKVRAAAGVYWMYYTGGCSEEIEIPKPDNLPMNLSDFKYNNGKVYAFRTRPGLVMSHDGRNWARIEGDHHSGSLFDVGTENEWDSLFIASPHVVFFKGDDLRMYYHSYDKKSGCFTVGYARSRDGMRWVKLGKILAGGAPGSFDELGVKCPQVVPHPDGTGFLMIYEGVSADGSSSFGLARSSDGLSKWERCCDKPVFSRATTQNAWDSREVHFPCLVHIDGDEWRLYYQGVDSAGVTGIGMAICADGKLLEFQRCHGLIF